MESLSQKLFKLGIAAHQNGNLKEAENFYRQVLKTDPRHPDANHNLGVLGILAGRADSAIPLFMTAITSNPKEKQYWVSCLMALLKLQKKEQAIKLIEAAKTSDLPAEFIETLIGQLNQSSEISLTLGTVEKQLTNFYSEGKFSEVIEVSGKLPTALRFHPSIQNIIGACHLTFSDFNKASFAYKRALLQEPHATQFYNNLGVVEHELGFFSKASISYKRAVIIEACFPNAHYNLGKNYQNSLDCANAIKAYKRSILLLPSNSQAYYNLGISLEDLELNWASILSYSRAAKIDPLSKDIYNNLALALTSYMPEAPGNIFISIVSDILEKNIFLRPNVVAPAILKWVRRHPDVVKLIGRVGDKRLEIDLIEVCLTLSKIKVFSLLMELCPITDIVIEEMLCHVRKELIFKRKSIDSCERVLAFQSSLAIQSFVNEFLYYETEEETIEIKKLEQEIAVSVAQNLDVPANAIACLGSYRLLFNYDWISKIKPTPALKKLLKTHVCHLYEEKKIRRTIKTLNPITQEVSLAVQEQYETNPYPRWINTRLVGTPKTTNELTKELKLDLMDEDSFSEQPDILIAGCGTGQHALFTASLFKNSRVLAIDLSLSSISYAKRKTKELGITNIEYLQADILDLRMLDRHFDIIESSGVLHHMADPYKGWETLVDCLKPNGLMAIGLYSDTALREVVEITNIIKKRDIPAEIRAMLNFRKEIIETPELLAKVTPFYDFYSTSEFRDLWFHVQQHRFNLPIIKQHLNKLGLKFSGFTLRGKEVWRQFGEKFPENRMLYDLDKWNDFEREFPDTFMEMYQFWCQKVV